MWLITTTLLLYVGIQLTNCESPCGTSCGPPFPDYNLGYFWRVYAGVVPPDAFPGGADDNGTTYIGQVYSKEYELLPGSIYPGCKTILTSAYLEDLKLDENIKILCTDMPDRLKWVPTRKGENYKLTKYHLVIGGSEVNYIVHIGRANTSDGELLIGKAFPDLAPNYGLWLPGNTVEVDEYEILVYQ